MKLIKFNEYYNEFNIDLAKRIDTFLEKYANISPNYDPDYDDYDERFTGPDPSMLSVASYLLKEGRVPNRVWSDWSSGSYSPISSKEGRLEHDDIIKELQKIMK